MNIDASERRNIEHFLWGEFSVGGDDNDIRSGMLAIFRWFRDRIELAVRRVFRALRRIF